MANLGSFLGKLTGTPVGGAIGSTAGGGLGSLLTTGTISPMSLAGTLNAFSGKEMGGQMLASALTPAFASMLGGAPPIAGAAAPTLSSLIGGLSTGATSLSSLLGPLGLIAMPIMGAIMGMGESHGEELTEPAGKIMRTAEQQYATLRDQIAQSTGKSTERTTYPFKGRSQYAFQQPSEVDKLVEEMAKAQGLVVEKESPLSLKGYYANLQDSGFSFDEAAAITNALKEDVITKVYTPEQWAQKEKLLKLWRPMTYMTPEERGEEHPAFVMGGAGP